MNYDFSTLNDKDLEELTRDILSRSIGINFQCFKMGADQGADLRYATDSNENEIIVQVKHYLGSGLSKLKRLLKKEEFNKIVKLNPRRYILVTSLHLSHKNKLDIKLILNPYIISTADILGREDLNSLLRTHPDIEEAHFKLWLSSTPILKRILKNGIKGRSEFVDLKIKERIKIFVPSRIHKKAVDILNNRNFILITGAPGIGKTTLADMLTYQLLATDFELIYVTEIREAEEAFESNKKQVFYFNDFLGTITLDLTSSRNTDTAIINFIERVKGDKFKRLILTCRTTILNQAKAISEVISNSKIEISNHEVKIEDYGNLERAKILYNHIYFSNLQDDLKTVFFKDHFYWKVIKHENYNPRLIEFFTDNERLQRNIDYDKEVLEFLDHPDKIWEKPYTIQLSDNSRLFLSTMFSLGNRNVIAEENLRSAFEARIDYEVKHNNYQRKSNTFNKVLHELLGAFIIRIVNVRSYGNSIEYKFFNPSIEDFLQFYFSEKNLEEYFNVLNSAIFFSQFKERISTNPDKQSESVFFSTKNYTKLLKIFIERIPHLQPYSGSKELETIICLIRLFQWTHTKDLLIEVMNNLFINKLYWGDRENLIEILDYIAENNLNNSFSFSLEEMFLKLTEDMLSYYQIYSLSKLISKHNIYTEFLERHRKIETEYFKTIQSNINKCWDKDLNDFISTTYGIATLTDKNELYKTIETRKEEAIKLNKLMRVDTSPIISDFSFDYDDQIIKNIAKKSEDKLKIENMLKDESKISESLEINRLFNHEGDEERDSFPW
jgi:adenylate kinase family enzyme